MLHICQTLAVSREKLKDRSSRPEVLCKKCFLRNFSKFTGKHLCHGLFFNKVAGSGLVDIRSRSVRKQGKILYL